MKQLITLLTAPPTALHHALSLDAIDAATLADAALSLPACNQEADWGAVAEIAKVLRDASLPDGAREALNRLDAILTRRGFPAPPPADELPLA